MLGMLGMLVMLGMGCWTGMNGSYQARRWLAMATCTHSPPTILPTTHRYFTPRHAMPPPGPNHSPRLYFDLDSNPGKLRLGEDFTLGPIRTSQRRSNRRSIDAAREHSHQPLDHPRILSQSHRFPFPPKRKEVIQANPVILGLLSQIYGGS